MTAESIAVLGMITSTLAAIGASALGAHLAYRSGIKFVEKAHANAIRILHRQEFNNAATKFRSAFKDELLALNPALSRNDTDTAELLKGAFDKHRLAVFDFMPFLVAESREGFNKAWKQYYAYDNAPEGTIHGLDKYSGVPHGYDETRRLRLLAAENIERILGFTAHK